MTIDEKEAKFTLLVMKLGNEAFKHGNASLTQVDALRAFLLERITHYADVLHFHRLDILEALERSRQINVVNFYQDRTLPHLNANHVYVLRNMEHYRQIVGITGFRCPACGGINLTDPYNCTQWTGHKYCDWKSYGFFGTMGKGLRLLLRDQFLENPCVEEIFMPVALEELFEDGKLKDGCQFPD